MLLEIAGHGIYQHQDQEFLSYAYTWFDGSADLNWTNELRFLRSLADIKQIDTYCRTLPAWAFINFICSHADQFLQEHLQLRDSKSVMIGIWPFAMTAELCHAPHNHPDSAISGTYYVTVPPNAGSIYFHNNDISESIQPKSGTLLLWNSDIRHSVPRQDFSGVRQAISFDLALAKR
jgi:hypothetical protein